MDWLESSLDYGITEFDFWNMTLAELERLLESKKRVEKLRAQEKATYDYILANLIGHSISRIYSSEAKYPEIYDVYPAIFDRDAIEEAREEEKNKQTFNWLKQFADSFNNNDTKEGKDIL